MFPFIEPALRLKIGPALFKRLVEASTERIPVIIEMKATADLNVALLEADVARRRQALASTLQATAQQSQAGVLATLSEREMLGTAANIRSLWIVNAVAADADLNTVLAVAARPEVRFVREDREYRITERLQI